MKNRTTVHVQLPEVCLPDTAFTPVAPATTCAPPPGSTVACTVVAASCAEVWRRPSATVSGLHEVTLLVTFTLAIVVIAPGGVPVCRTKQTSQFEQKVTMHADPCALTCCQACFTCGPCIALDDVVCCRLAAELTVWTAVPPPPPPPPKKGCRPCPPAH